MPVYSDMNGVPKSEGRVTHLGLAEGELANRLVVVGHISRADILKQMLEPEVPGSEVSCIVSARGFTTYTGLFAGVRVSVMATGMGLAMMDFAVREARAIVKGPMLIVRFGTCGLLQKAVPVGGVGVASEGSFLVQRNYGAFSSDGTKLDGAPVHVLSNICLADAKLSESITLELKNELGPEAVQTGLNVSCDSFYGSQGRIDPAFVDENESLLTEILEKHPSALTAEMESFQLLHLALCSRPVGSIRAAAATVLVANRLSGMVVDHEDLVAAERNGGLAILRAVAQFPLD